MKRPYVLIGALSIILSFITLFCNIWIILLFSFLILLAFFIIFCIKGNKLFKNSNNTVVIIAFILLVASCIFTVSCVYAPTLKLAGTTANFEGTIIREPEHNGEWTVYTLKGEHAMLKGNFKCNIVTKDNIYNIGDRLNITITSEPIENTYKNNHLADGVFLSSYIKSINEVKAGNSPIYRNLGKLRVYIKNQIYSVCEGDIGGVMLALLTGNHEFISDAFYEKTKVCGVTHIMVVSGLHVGILSGVLLKFLSKLKVKRKISVFLCFALFFLLIALCDFHTSAIRSVVMSSIMLLGSLISRRADPLNSLGFAVTIMALMNPFVAGSPSFLLSVFATFGVVFIAPIVQYLTEVLRAKGKLARLFNGIIDSVIVSLSATVCVLPISIYYFGYTSLLSPLVTVLIGFSVEIALISVALGVILAAIPFIKLLSIPIIYISGLFTRYINAVIDFFGSFDIFIFNVEPDFAPLAFIFCSLLIFTVWILYNNKKQKERKDEDAARREVAQKLS